MSIVAVRAHSANALLNLLMHHKCGIARPNVL